MQKLDQKNAIVLFEESLKSQATKTQYISHLKKYMEFIGSKQKQDPFFRNDPKKVEQKIIEFIIFMKQKEGKGYFSIRNNIWPVLTFYKINDIVLNVSKIKRYFPSKTRTNRDRAYTHEEIHQMLDIADERMRAVILLLASSGTRIGAVPLLRLRNLEKVNLDYDQHFYKITVYENEFEEEYTTYCTPECAGAIDLYLDMRTRYGEALNKDSFLVREQFDVRDPIAIKNSIKRPLKTTSLPWIIRDIAIRAGLRSEEKIANVPNGSIRKEVAITKGLRKFFSTQLVESDLKTELRWLLEGHNLKANDSNYIRTTAKSLQQEYEKAIFLLTINEENRLKNRIEKLEVEKSQLELLTKDVALLKRKMSINKE